MQSILRPLSISFFGLAILACGTSCSTTHDHPPIVAKQSRLGRVTHVTTDFNRHSGSDRASWGILQGGILGSVIGSGAAANAAGAVGGMLVGGLIGNASDNRAADTIYRTVEVKVSDGESIVVHQRYDKNTPVVKVGDRVIVEFDSRGAPSRVFSVAGGSKW